MENSILKAKLLEFKQLTESLIEVVEQEEAAKVDELFLERQQVIDYIEGSKYSKEEFIQIAGEIRLSEINKKLEASIENKKSELKFKMNNLMQQKNANNSYLKSSNRIRNFFNTEV